jgi:hypothetical protein
MVDAATLRKLAALKLAPEQMTGVLSLLADLEETHEARLAAEEDRKRRDRERKIRGRSAENPRTMTGKSAENPSVVSPKERSPAPPKEITPSTSLRSDIHPQARASSAGEELAMVLDRERANAVLDHRQRLRKPLTPHAARLLARKFAQCADPNAAADAMIANGWQGFDPAWLERRGGTGPPSLREPSRNGFAAHALDLAERHDEPPNDPADHHPASRP